MSDVAAALRAATEQLSAVSATARLDAELLLAHALGVDRNHLLLEPGRFAVPPDFAALVARRQTHEPIAYILGYRDFWTVRIAVGPGVLVPRADSETLLSAAAAHFAETAPRRILDLGTGPGTLLLAALDQWPSATGLGVDAAPAALDYARANAAALSLSGRAAFCAGDWTAGLSERFDLILCNPPYIAEDEALMPEVRAYEPAAALFAGADGLCAYRQILPDLARLLTPEGIALIEIGWQQTEAVAALASAAGFDAECHRDLAGRNRALLLRINNLLGAGAKAG